MERSVVVVTAAEMIVLGCSGLLSYLAFRASRRTGSPSLRTLMIGLGFVASGALVGVALQHVGTTDFTESMGIESVFTALGFVVVLYALYIEDSNDGIVP